MKIKLQERLKELRKEQGLTQKQLAEKLFLDTSTVTKWETGQSEPKLETLVALAKFFNCSLDFLVGIKDD